MVYVLPTTAGAICGPVGDLLFDKFCRWNLRVRVPNQCATIGQKNVMAIKCHTQESDGPKGSLVINLCIQIQILQYLL